jgi:DNA-binding transcriptional LysR family regulator
MDFELRYLPAFRAVCETGSLRAAALTLHRTEQALSYQIRRLEERLGTPLFDRRAGRLAPNARGLRLLEFCRDMHRDWSRVRDALDETAGDAPLRIAAVSGFGRYVLLPLFRDGPLADVPLRMHYPTAPDVARAVLDGTADLGFVHCPQPHDRLVHEPVAQEEIVMIGPPHMAATGLEKLHQAPFVTYDESDYVFATWFAQVAGTAPPPLHAVAHFEELEEVLAWVAAGRGLSIVPADCAASAAGRGDVAVLRWPGRRCTNAIHALHVPAMALPPAGVRLLRELRDLRLSDA